MSVKNIDFGLLWHLFTLLSPYYSCCLNFQTINLQFLIIVYSQKLVPEMVISAKTFDLAQIIRFS